MRCAVRRQSISRRSKSMGRAILAVIVSYVVMFLLLFAGFTCAYLILGADQAFKPGSYQVSNRWLALSFALHIVVGLIGGFLCAAIAKGGKAPLALAVVAIVVGLLLLLFAGFSCAYLILGAAQAFKPGSYQVSNRWLALSFALHIVVGLIGGSR